MHPIGNQKQLYVGSSILFERSKSTSAHTSKGHVAAYHVHQHTRGQNVVVAQGGLHQNPLQQRLTKYFQWHGHLLQTQDKVPGQTGVECGRYPRKQLKTWF